MFEHPLFDSLYDVRDDDREPFGENWCGPDDQLPHMENVLVATYESGEDSDGNDVEVYQCAMPARFWTIVAKDGVNTVGETNVGFRLSTGSGGREMAEYIHKTAELISEGMLGVRLGETDESNS